MSALVRTPAITRLLTPVITRLSTPVITRLSTPVIPRPVRGTSRGTVLDRVPRTGRGMTMRDTSTNPSVIS
jgi:hypothetical protein